MIDGTITVISDFNATIVSLTETAGRITIVTNDAPPIIKNEQVNSAQVITIIDQGSSVVLRQPVDNTTISVISSEATPVLTLQMPGIQGPPGAPGAKGDPSAFYNFSQISPATEWNINHNLGFYPSVSIFTTGMQAVDGGVTQISLNQTKIYFEIPFAGFARLT